MDRGYGIRGSARCSCLDLQRKSTVHSGIVPCECRNGRFGNGNEPSGKGRKEGGKYPQCAAVRSVHDSTVLQGPRVVGTKLTKGRDDLAPSLRSRDEFPFSSFFPAGSFPPTDYRDRCPRVKRAAHVKQENQLASAPAAARPPSFTLLACLGSRSRVTTRKVGLERGGMWPQNTREVL